MRIQDVKFRWVWALKWGFFPVRRLQVSKQVEPQSFGGVLLDTNPYWGNWETIR